MQPEHNGQLMHLATMARAMESMSASVAAIRLSAFELEQCAKRLEALWIDTLREREQTEAIKRRVSMGLGPK